MTAMGMSAAEALILVSLSVFFLFATVSADDAAVMTKLAAALTSAPSGWGKGDFCSWEGVNCDSSGKVTALNLASKSLVGTLPSQLAELTQLKTLALQVNSLAGPLPTLANLSLLQSVYLDSNNFTAVPAGFFGGLAALQKFSISQNLNLAQWSIPSELTQSVSLASFSASNANLVGSIPDIFGSFPNLIDLRLSYNNLTGTLPPSFGGSQIRNLWLNNQAVGLSGTVDVLGNMTQLYQVWLQNNLFSGPIPDLSQCQSLFDLQLRDNEFTGVVPSSLAALTTLKNVTLSNNQLQGPAPVFSKGVQVTLGDTNQFCTTNGSACDPQVTALLSVASALGYPKSLAEAWQGDNACEDWKSVTCDPQGKNVTSVNFAKQGFSGKISPAFVNLTSLKFLYLSDNNLTGSIPDSLTRLSQLQTLDVSNNNLSGQIPKFASSVKLVTTGNVLIGKDTNTGGGGGGAPSPGSNNTATPGSPSGTSSGSSSSTGVIVGIVIAVLVFLAIVLFICYKCYLKRRRQKLSNAENHQVLKKVVNNGAVPMGVINGYTGVPSELQSQSSGDHSEIQVFEGGNVVISFQVLQQVTNNFSEDNILGRGGFGVVYRGALHDGTQIAVKRMTAVAMGSKGMNEFQAELAVLTKVRHRHLVALLGFCVNGNERLLVFEYMPKGTLTQHLFDWRENGVTPLTWKQRVAIALDVARGVEYLHSLAQQSFIHRDLKPSNILLGDDMRAKVADFGLVRNAPDGKYSVETRLAGTFGYLAPEYAATGRVTTKVDVYAFGVVLMELITGRKALDETLPDEKSHLVTWFRRVLINKDNIPKAIDQTLELSDETFESICKVAELAGHCTARESYQRPDMGHAVNVLGPLVQQWRPTSQEEEDGGNALQMSLPQVLQRWQADEGTSAMYSDLSYSQSISSLPSKPSGFADTFDSMNCR